MVAAATAAGGVIALLIVLSLAGKIQPVEVPETDKATYAGQEGEPASRGNRNSNIRQLPG